MTERGISVPLMLLAWLLALGSVAAGVRAVAIHLSPPAPPDGAFGVAGGSNARALARRLAGGLMALQEEDGGFRAAWEGGFQSGLQRVSSSAIGIAALTSLRTSGLGDDLEHLDDAVNRGLDFLIANQQDTGSIGDLPLGSGEMWYQADATAAGILALVQSDRAADETGAAAAGPALARYARDGLRLGWTRSLAAMAVAKTFALGRESIFPPKSGRLVRWREPGQKRDTSDWRVNEAIVRLTLVDKLGLDPYPSEIQAACAAEPPVWSGQGSDLQSWWMQAWVMARSPEPEPWFANLLEAVGEEAVNDEDRIPGGHYADGIIQTGCAILALLEGLTAQVVVR